MQGADEIPGGVERRKKERIHGTFLVWVRGVDAEGRTFRAHTLLDNLSACGLYMQLPRRVDPGSRLLMQIRLMSPLLQVEAVETSRVSARGIVRRTEERSHGLWGLGVEFTTYRLLPAVREV